MYKQWICLFLLAGSQVQAQFTDRGFELTKEQAAAFLGIDQGSLNRLADGKERLTEAGFDEFREQFGLLPNGLPTFQIAEGKYFVLLPLNHVDQQATFDAESNAGQLEKLREGQTPPDNDGAGAVVDHSLQQSPIKNQGERGTCVAFASCAELEAIEKRLGRDWDLAENFAYLCYMQEEGSTPCQDPGLATFRAAGYLQKYNIGQDMHWPYDPDLNPCDVIDKAPVAIGGTAGLGVEEYLHLPKGTEINPDGSVDIRDTKTLEDLLTQGHDIVFGSVVAWKTSQLSGIVDVTLGPAGQPIFGSGGHAMLIVGFDSRGPKPFFIVKNSWGTDLGHSGYLHFSYDYIRTYAKYGYVTTKVRHANVDLTDLPH